MKYRVERLDGKPIPEDEPIFVLRGQDALAARIVHLYADEYREIAVNDPWHQDKVSDIRAIADRMEAWRPKKMPG